jgi:hypothetical protein
MNDTLLHFMYLHFLYIHFVYYTIGYILLTEGIATIHHLATAHTPITYLLIISRGGFF